MNQVEYYAELRWAIGQAECWTGALPDSSAAQHRARLKALRRETVARQRAENGTVSLKRHAYVGQRLGLSH